MGLKVYSNLSDGTVKRFFNIPEVRVHGDEQTQKMSEERRRVWITNIDRKVKFSKRRQLRSLISNIVFLWFATCVVICARYSSQHRCPTNFIDTSPKVMD